MESGGESGGGAMATVLHQKRTVYQDLDRSWLSVWWSHSWGSASSSWEELVGECVTSLFMLETLSCMWTSTSMSTAVGKLPSTTVLWPAFNTLRRNPLLLRQEHRTLSVPHTWGRTPARGLFSPHRLLPVVRLTVDAAGHCWACVIRRLPNMTATRSRRT